MKLKRIGECSRCGKCCNINNFPFATGTTIAQTREDGSCTRYYERDGLGGCMKHPTVGGKPLICQLFPMGPEDIASLPDCTYSFVEVEHDVEMKAYIEDVKKEVE